MTRLYIRSTRDHTPKSRHPQSIGTLRSRPPGRPVALPRSRERQRCRPPRNHRAGSGGGRRGSARVRCPPLAHRTRGRRRADRTRGPAETRRNRDWGRGAALQRTRSVRPGSLHRKRVGPAESRCRAGRRARGRGAAQGGRRQRRPATGGAARAMARRPTLGSALTAIGRSPIQSALRVLLADERARGIVSTWFVLCGTPTLKTMRAGDLTYLPEGSGAAAALRELREHGCEINLHGSFVTSEHHEVFAEQRGRLARLTEQPVLGVRQHFLRMRPGITSRGMAEAGFRYDTTWGFPDQNGFRLGVGDVIPAWDGEGERALELLEAPVIWMDRALSKYAGVEDSAAWITEGMSLARTCRDVEGLWVGVWHPNLTDALGFPDAPAAFAKLLDELVAEEPFMAPLGRLIEWRVARRAVRVRGILPDGRPDAYTDAPAPSHDTLTLADASGARRYSIPAMPR